MHMLSVTIAVHANAAGIMSANLVGEARNIGVTAGLTMLGV